MKPYTTTRVQFLVSIDLEVDEGAREPNQAEIELALEAKLEVDENDATWPGVKAIVEVQHVESEKQARVIGYICD